MTGFAQLDVEDRDQLEELYRSSEAVSDSIAQHPAKRSRVAEPREVLCVPPAMYATVFSSTQPPPITSAPTAGPAVQVRDLAFSPSAPPVPAAPAERRAAASQAPQADDVLDNAVNVDDEVPEVFFGSIRCHVVAVRYCTAIVSSGELTLLVRQPGNQYDRFAIAVHNVRGHQVGYIERTVAAALSPLIDAGKLRVEGIVTDASRAVLKMPVYVHMYGREDDRAIVVAHLRQHAIIHQQQAQPKTAAPSPPTMRSAAAKADAGPALSHLERSMDSLLMNLLEGKPAILPEAPQPAGVRSAMYPHQRQALHWMTTREAKQHVGMRSPEESFFWDVRRQGSNTVFFNTLTNTAVTEPPELTRGGIIADEMGLGKTLQMIALIVAQKQPNAPNPTLVVCPLSVISHWQHQLQRHTVEGELAVYVYHGPDRIRNPAELSRYDVVVTTYNMVAHEYDPTADTQTSPLMQVHWFRVVLDESHMIKVGTTRQAKAAFALQAECRWALSATPIQNSLHDLFATMRFLRIEPFSELAWWNRIIIRPLKQRNPTALARLRSIMRAISLRRMKSDHVEGRPLVVLPPRHVKIKKLQLSLQERMQYEAMFSSARQRFKQLLDGGTLAQSYGTALEILLRLRQLCNHSELCSSALAAVDSGSAEDRAAQVERLVCILRANDGEECSICLDTITRPVITPCAHFFCYQCIATALKQTSVQCPLCRAVIPFDQLLEPPPEPLPHKRQSKTDGVGLRVSTKLDALVRDILELRTADAGLKSLVFSQWTRMLDLTQAALGAAGVRCVRLDGSVSAAKRVHVLKSFESDASVEVMLISIKAGGVGLDLTAASRVFLLDPWWNPATEDQAIDRCHRIGQTRPVIVTRYIIEDSVEERILELQEKKRRIASCAFDSSHGHVNMLNDIISMFT